MIIKEEIQANRLDRGYERYKEEFNNKALEVLNSGWYVLGEEVKGFEREFARYLGVENCVGLASDFFFYFGCIYAIIFIRLNKYRSCSIDRNPHHTGNICISLNNYFIAFPNSQNTKRYPKGV